MTFSYALYRWIATRRQKQKHPLRAARRRRINREGGCLTCHCMSHFVSLCAWSDLKHPAPQQRRWSFPLDATRRLVTFASPCDRERLGCVEGVFCMPDCQNQEDAALWCPLTIASIAVPDPLRPRLNASHPGLDSSVVCHSADDPGLTGRLANAVTGKQKMQASRPRGGACACFYIQHGAGNATVRTRAPV